MYLSQHHQIHNQKKMYFVMDLYLIVLCLLVIYIKGKLKGIYDFIYMNTFIYSPMPQQQACGYLFASFPNALRWKWRIWNNKKEEDNFPLMSLILYEFTFFLWVLSIFLYPELFPIFIFFSLCFYLILVSP